MGRDDAAAASTWAAFKINDPGCWLALCCWRGWRLVGPRAVECTEIFRCTVECSRFDSYWQDFAKQLLQSIAVSPSSSQNQILVVLCIALVPSESTLYSLTASASPPRTSCDLGGGGGGSGTPPFTQAGRHGCIVEAHADTLKPPPWVSVSQHMWSQQPVGLAPGDESIPETFGSEMPRRFVK